MASIVVLSSENSFQSGERLKCESPAENSLFAFFMPWFISGLFTHSKNSLSVERNTMYK